MSAPTGPGQSVQDTQGRIGITTAEPRRSTPQIGVQFLGAPYPFLVQIEDLTVITLTVA